MKFPWRSSERYSAFGPYFFAILMVPFSQLYRSSVGVVLRAIAWFFDTVIGFLVPRFIVDLRGRARELQLWPIFWVSAVISIFWSLVGNGLFAILNGTFCGTTSFVSRAIRQFAPHFCGDDPAVYYYTDDLPNLIIYFPLTPLYIGISVCVIAVWIAGYRKLQAIVDPAPARPGGKLHGRAVLLSSVPLFVLLFIPLVATLNYAREYVLVGENQKMFWYLRKLYEKTPAGDVPKYYYDTSGIYYLVSNNVKLLIVVAAIISFITMSVLVIRLGAHVDAYDFARAADSKRISNVLRDYNLLSTLIKWLVLVLSFHFLFWSESRPSQGLNIKVSAAFLIIFGVFFLNTPRYYAEERYLLFIEKIGKGSKKPKKHQDFRSDRYKLLQSAIDTITIVSALSVAIAILLGSDLSIKKLLDIDLSIRK